MMERTPAPEAIADAMRSLMREVWTALPARVLAYDATSSTLTAQPVPADYLQGVAVALPTLYDVPVLWPRGGGSFITWPLSVGDRVTLIIGARSLDRYRADGAEGDPQSVRTHDLSDAVALPMGLWPDSGALSADATDLVINKPTGGVVSLGGTGGSAVARNGDSVNMGAGGGTSWATWAVAVNAALGGAVGRLHGNCNRRYIGLPYNHRLNGRPVGRRRL